MRVHVDVRAERVQLGAMEVLGQWVDFYALLALARTERSDPETYVSAEAVARVGAWRHKAPASVGKEVARHLAKLESKGLGRLVGCRGRTRSWRLDVPPKLVVLKPDRGAVRGWIDARSMHAMKEDGWVDGLRALVDATVLIQRGDAGSTLERLRGIGRAIYDVEPAAEAWSALLRGRSAYQHYDEDDEILSQLHDAWSRRSDPPGKVVGARLRTFLALRYRFEEPSATMASLAKLAADLEFGGDIGSLAAVVNVMGILSRRAGNPEVGAGHHLRAAALFGIAGDYPSLQAALFNLAICRREMLALNGRPPDEAVLGLVEMCLVICSRFGIGGDSAQAEIAGAQWAQEMGDIPRARRYLEEAAALLQTIDSTYDQACFLEARAQIERAAPDGSSDPARDLRAAEARFSKVGDESSAARVRRILVEIDPKRKRRQ